MSFNNKVAIVTGSSSGIGASIAIEFAKEGADVAIVGRNEAKLNNVAEEFEKNGKKPLIIKADLTKDAERVVEETIKKFGKLDILVNNAGLGVDGTLLQGNIMKSYDKVMDTNLRSVVHITSLSVPHLVKTKGNIINISSAVSEIISSRRENLMYTVSKAALDHFTRGAAKELADEGVRVNSVNPGPVKTDILLNLGFNSEQSEQSWKAYEKRMPLKRVSDPVEVADLVLFLASDKARGITGSCFLTDNGMRIK